MGVATFTATAVHAADISVARYGAKGDGTTLNTIAIQKAIDAAAKEGDTVVFPAGVYLTGSIFVKSGVTLKLDKGVTLTGSQNIADYPVMPTRIAGIEMRWPAALVNIYKQRNAAIVGEGTIDGNGKVFWEACAGRLTTMPSARAWCRYSMRRMPGWVAACCCAAPGSGPCTCATRTA